MTSQDETPYADALLAYAESDWLRFGVPGHRGQGDGAPGLVAAFGEVLPGLDIPPMIDGIDKGTRPTPLDRSLALAAEAWGARRTWFLTNGASQGNLAVCLTLRQLGREAVIQRSVHSSVVEGLALSGLDAHFVQPGIDRQLGVAHGVTPAALADSLRANPGAVAAVVVSPTYFGAVSDIGGLVRVAHDHGVPLIVDEAWGSHLGFHPDVPARALSFGADLVVSSTHKLGGSLTQSAMLHLGDGPFADSLEPAVERAFRTFQSTSESAVLLFSLDVARRRLAVDGTRAIGSVLREMTDIRGQIASRARFTLADDRFRESPAVFALDPLRLCVDTRSGGISGYEARNLLAEQHLIHIEMSTDAVLVAIVGPGAPVDVDRFVTALHGLPRLDDGSTEPLELPEPGPSAMSVRRAYFSPSELVPARKAEGRVAADSLSAYPPGIPNVLPGEVLTAETIDFLRRTAASPSGLVRGGVDDDLQQIRVVASP